MQYCQVYSKVLVYINANNKCIYQDIYNLFSKSFAELNCLKYENYFKINDKRKSPAVEANSTIAKE